MAELVTVARPYAEAAFRTALSNNNLQQWSEMLDTVGAVVSDPAVVSRLGDPNVSDRALQDLLLGIVGEHIDGQGRNFVQLLVENGRLELVPDIREVFAELRREHEGVLEALVVSAMPMGDDQLRPLVSALESKYGRRITARVEVDSSLIGGVRVSIGDKVIDATVQGRLDAMAAALLQ